MKGCKKEIADFGFQEVSCESAIEARSSISASVRDQQHKLPNVTEPFADKQPQWVAAAA
jgi:hypothetical protein